VRSKKITYKIRFQKLSLIINWLQIKKNANNGWARSKKVISKIPFNFFLIINWLQIKKCK